MGRRACRRDLPAADPRAAVQDPLQAGQERPETKAVVEASRQAQRSPLDLRRGGGGRQPYQFHWRRFLFENFPNGTGFRPCRRRRSGHPAAGGCAAFSIDDSATTEIDDALSVQGLGTGTVVFGVHIAAPALAFEPESAIDQVARARLSTAYMPGHKLTMLPDDVVQATR